MFFTLIIHIFENTSPRAMITYTKKDEIDQQGKICQLAKLFRYQGYETRQNLYLSDDKVIAAGYVSIPSHPTEELFDSITDQFTNANIDANINVWKFHPYSEEE